MRSIQRHVAAWTLGASLLGAVVLGGTAYVAVLDEMNEMLDANLREVASTVARLPSLPGPVPAASVTSGPDAELEIVIQAWTPTRERLFSSRPTLALPFIEGEGLSRVRLAGIDWDVYTLRRADRVVQAAQRARAQGVEAAESTGRILLTLLAVAAVVGLLMWLALRRGLRSLQDAATMVAARSPQRLTPITDDSAPRELK
ncbi:MAG: hypothetical protein HY021_07170, partial [Burkholderiales bacterium]|nr:hypothetical protein [Burkholderiales bacterium]